MIDFTTPDFTDEELLEIEVGNKLFEMCRYFLDGRRKKYLHYDEEVIRFLFDRKYDQTFNYRERRIVDSRKEDYYNWMMEQLNERKKNK